jgi:mono/diheme cytochrome c family protein
MAAKEANGDVAAQLILTLGYSKDDAVVIPAVDAILQRHIAHEGVFQAACVTFWKHPTPYMKQLQDGSAIAGRADAAVLAMRWKQGFAQWERGLAFAKDFPKERKKSIESGEVLYFQTCVACHGADGKGTLVPGTELALAPPLAGSTRVKGDPKHLLPVFVNGLMGPIDGKTYQGAFMSPATALGILRDDRLADVVNFIRYAWGNESASLQTEQVKQLRTSLKNRTAPWTDAELK